MLKLYPRKAHVICCIIIGSFVQAQGFSTTVVKEGEDATIECGLQTKVEEGYLTWEAITHDTTVVLAYDIRDGQSSCDDRIINCTLYANGSIQLESVSKEDGARYYRCLRGDEDGYNYYSDHWLLVLSKEKTSSPPSIETPHRESVNSYKMGKKGVLHAYNAPVCDDDVDGNLPVVCYPPSGVIVDREYETIQCNCTDSDGLMDSVTFLVTRQISSPPSIETPHRESVSSYKMGKKVVLHGYNAPLCEDDVDGNLPVVCYPPSGIIVDRKYETIQCNCTDSDGQMDNVTFPVTRITHWLHSGWRKAFISLLVLSIPNILLLILVCHTQYKHLKESKTNYGHAVNNSQTELTARDEELSPLTDQLEQKEKQETEMKNKLEEQNEKIIQIEKELAVKEAENIGLGKRLEDNQQLNSSLQKILADHQFVFKQQCDSVMKQGSKYQEDDKNSEFDKNPSPSEKETKEEGSPRKGKKRDPERGVTVKALPQMSPEGHTTEDKENLGKDETYFSKRCSDDTGTNVSRVFKEYITDDETVCKGLTLPSPVMGHED